MTAVEWMQWLLIFGPLAISPGPANVLFAAMGSSFGVKASLPFWLGTNITCILQSLAIGFGLGFILSEYPGITEIIKLSGIAVLFFLAYRFFKLSASRNQPIKPLGFKAGIMVEFFNAKYLLIPTVMFSQFYSPEQQGVFGIAILTLMLGILTMLSNFVWIFGGKALTALTRHNTDSLQGKVFGTMLFITAIWLAFS